MATFNSLEALLTALDEMDIYQKDYDVIVSLLENTTPKFFTKVLEEVLEGNLYWSDFEKVLSPEYEKELRDSLDKQKELNNYIKKIITFRRFINSDYEYDYEKGTLYLRNNLGSDKDPLFKEEYTRIRDSILNNLTKERDDDNAVTLALKIRLYNAIKNGQVLLKLQNESPSALSGYTVTDVGIKNNSTNEEFDYINPDDIFLFINSYTIPLDHEHQTLNDFDKVFMTTHKLDEETVKHFKAIGILLRKQQFFGLR